MVHLQWTAWVTLAALLLYLWTTFNVGRARGKFQVKAPSMDGPLPFQSAYRVQANTLEQMVAFLPAMWLCAVFFSDRWAAAGGALWVLGRIWYALAYYKDPAKRGPGFILGLGATSMLLVASAAGLLLH